MTPSTLPRALGLGLLTGDASALTVHHQSSQELRKLRDAGLLQLKGKGSPTYYLVIL